MSGTTNDDAVLAIARAVESQSAVVDAIARTAESQGAALEALTRIVRTQQEEGGVLADAVRGMTHQLGRMTIRQAEVMDAAKKRNEAAMAELRKVQEGRRG